jgi:type II secretory pathway pseudopilin PulG
MKSVMDVRSRVTPRSDAGFALLEVIVSAAVLALMALAVLSGIDGATSASGREKARSVAAALAEQDQEKLRSMPVEQLVAFGTQTAAVPVNGANYSVTTRVEWVRDDTGGTVSCANDKKVADYLHITSTVTSNVVGTRTAPVVIDSIVAPDIAYSTTHGTLAVKVTNEAGQPVVGIPVAPSGASTPLPENTNQQGCAVFESVPVGNYVATLNSAGMVDKLGNQVSTSASNAVTAGKLTLITMDYDIAGTANVTVETYKPGSTTASNPIASKALRVTAENSASIGWRRNQPTRTVTAPEAATFAVGSLYPFTTPYALYTGACAYSNPTKASANSGYYGSYPGSVLITPGGTPPVTVRQPPLNLRVAKDYNSTSSPAEGMVVYATPVQASGDSCVEPSIQLQTWNTSATNTGVLGRTKSADGTYVDAGVPFGYYTICFQRGASQSIIYPTDTGGTNYDNTNPLGLATQIALDLSNTSKWRNSACVRTP